MFYTIRSENDIISLKYAPNTQVSEMELWADFSREHNRSHSHSTNSEYRKCPECGNAVSSFLWGNERSVRISNTRYPDVEFLWGDDLIVSHRFKSAYFSGELTGIEAFENIEISGKNQPPFEYYNCRISFSNIRWRFTKLSSKNKTKTLSNCKTCGKLIEHTNGIIFDESSWEGYDIFQIYNAPHRFFISEKMLYFIKNMQLKNVVSTPVDECAW